MRQTNSRFVESFDRFLNSINERHESEIEHYMFFQDLQLIKQAVDSILFMDSYEVDGIISDGHDWASDHIATAKAAILEVSNFLKVKTEEPETVHEEPSEEAHQEEDQD